MKQIKMKNDKKLFILIELVLAGVVVILAFLMLRGRAGKEPEKVSVVIQNSDDSQWAAFLYGLKMAAQDSGIELTVVTTGELLTDEEQLALIEDEIDNGADAFIVQPAVGEEVTDALNKLSVEMPLVLVGHPTDADDVLSAIPTVGPDDYELGKALAFELLRDCEGRPEGKKIAVFTKSRNMETPGTEETAIESAAVNRRLKGFEDALQDSGIEIFSSYSIAMTRENVDFVVALDDSCLNELGAAAAQGYLGAAQVYGIGHSTEAVSFLDAGHVKRLVVPDEFSVGYQSLMEIAGRLNYPYREMHMAEVSYTVISGENLFTKENQEILYTMSQ